MSRDMMNELVKSRSLPADAGGILVEITPEQAGWEFIRFTVHRVAAGSAWHRHVPDEECCVVLLSGAGSVSVDDGPPEGFGPRPSVFEGYPHAVYVPHGHQLTFRAERLSEIAECRAPSKKRLEPKIIRPEDCGFEIRGGGNATRQIVDILPPSFPADRLLICEVFTPSGNWSSYPPHKHDVDNPPSEVDLDETYYYRMRGAHGYGFQRLYTADGSSDRTLKVEDGDLVLIREGYHPFVAAYGFDTYYLNVLAGARRSMAASDDPRYASLRAAWPPPDPRVPLLPRPTRATTGSVTP